MIAFTIMWVYVSYMIMSGMYATHLEKINTRKTNN